MGNIITIIRLWLRGKITTEVGKKRADDNNFTLFSDEEDLFDTTPKSDYPKKKHLSVTTVDSKPKKAVKPKNILIISEKPNKEYPNRNTSSKNEDKIKLPQEDKLRNTDDVSAKDIEKNVFLDAENLKQTPETDQLKKDDAFHNKEKLVDEIPNIYSDGSSAKIGSPRQKVISYSEEGSSVSSEVGTIDLFSDEFLNSSAIGDKRKNKISSDILKKDMHTDPLKVDLFSEGFSKREVLPSKVSKKESKIPITVDLFTDDLFGKSENDDIFSSGVSNNKASNIPKVDLFSDENMFSTTPKGSLLFADEEDLFDTSKLDKPKSIYPLHSEDLDNSSTKTKLLFDETGVIKPTNENQEKMKDPLLSQISNEIVPDSTNMIISSDEQKISSNETNEKVVKTENNSISNKEKKTLTLEKQKSEKFGKLNSNKTEHGLFSDDEDLFTRSNKGNSEISPNLDVSKEVKQTILDSKKSDMDVDEDIFKKSKIGKIQKTKPLLNPDVSEELVSDKQEPDSLSDDDIFKKSKIVKIQETKPLPNPDVSERLVSDKKEPESLSDDDIFKNPPKIENSKTKVLPNSDLSKEPILDQKQEPILLSGDNIFNNPPRTEISLKPNPSNENISDSKEQNNDVLKNNSINDPLSSDKSDVDILNKSPHPLDDEHKTSSYLGEGYSVNVSSNLYVEKQDNNILKKSPNENRSPFSDDIYQKIPPPLSEKTDLLENPTSSGLFSDDDDIFERPQKSGQSKKNTYLFSEDSDDDLFSSQSLNSTAKSTDGSIPDEKRSNVAKKAKTGGSSTVSGKVKHNLNINVTALLPGATPLKNKLKSPDLEDSTKKDFDNPENFPDSPLENVDILASAAKQRVRIPIKRRPSTRKARQEAIRKSGMDFIWDEPLLETDQASGGTENYISQTESEKNIQNVANNNLNQGEQSDDIFSDSSDLFGSTTTETRKVSNASKMSEKAFENSDMFRAKKTERVVKKSLFDDEDDDDMFSGVVSKPSSAAAGSISASGSTKKPNSRIKKLTAHSDDIVTNDPLDVINK